MGNNMVVVIVYYAVVRHLYEVMEINVRDCWDFFSLLLLLVLYFGWWQWWYGSSHDASQEGIKLIACFIENISLCALLYHCLLTTRIPYIRQWQSAIVRLRHSFRKCDCSREFIPIESMVVFLSFSCYSTSFSLFTSFL